VVPPLGVVPPVVPLAPPDDVVPLEPPDDVVPLEPPDDVVPLEPLAEVPPCSVPPFALPPLDIPLEPALPGGNGVSGSSTQPATRQTARVEPARARGNGIDLLRVATAPFGRSRARDFQVRKANRS
jgi:hypothetical protein